MSLPYNVSIFAQEHAQILAELASLDYAPSALQTATGYVNDLHALIKDAEKRLKAAEKEKRKEYDEHHLVKESVFRKLAYRATGQGGKWDAKATKEEREYLDAFEKFQKEEHALKALKANLHDAQQNAETLQTACARRDVLQRDLEQIYSRVFDGPTPEAPQDDHLEWALQRAENENNRFQTTLGLESQTLAILADAAKVAGQVEGKMRECENASDADVWGGGHGADMMEHSALSAAQMLAQQLDTLLAQARRMNPAVKAVQEVQLPKASMSDVVFDGLLADLAQHEKIQEGHGNAQRTVKTVQTEVSRAQGRVAKAAAAAQPSADAVARARMELHAFRKATFEAFAAQSAPPQYQPPPQPENATFAPPSGPPPPFAAGSDHQQPAPQSFPESSAAPEGASSSAQWSNMNPYAALLVRKSTLDAHEVPKADDAK